MFADTRTNAGVDNIDLSQAARVQQPGHRIMAIAAATTSRSPNRS
jgi:predicted proteasome-type protease